MTKRYLVIICSCMALIAGGCASIGKRAAQQIEYIVPQTKAAPGDVEYGRITFLQKKYRLFSRPDLKEKMYAAFLPVPLGTKPGEYRIKCRFTVTKGKQTIREKIPIQIMPDFRSSVEEQVRAPGFRIKVFEQEQEQVKRRLTGAGYKTKKFQDFCLLLGGPFFLIKVEQIVA
ncbi:hypothetical protein KAR10_07780 [bacterium]|nr:hypothetical protein [bacterium]